MSGHREEITRRIEDQALSNCGWTTTCTDDATTAKMPSIEEMTAFIQDGQRQLAKMREDLRKAFEDIGIPCVILYGSPGPAVGIQKGHYDQLLKALGAETQRTAVPDLAGFYIVPMTTEEFVTAYLPCG